jgi:hypothetical protein
LSEGILPRLGEDFSTLGHELTEDGHRVRRMGALVTAGTMQALDRGRAMVFALPAAFDKTLTYSAEHGLNGVETASLSGLAVGATLGTWSWLVGRSFHASLNQFPATTEKVTENHPVMVDVISSAVGGFVSREELGQKEPVAEGGYAVGPYEARKSRLGKAMLAVGRGYKAALLYGTTAYVGVAKTKQYSDTSNEELRRTVTAEAAVAMGTIGVGVSAAVTSNFLGVAEGIRDTVTSKPILFSASAIIIGISAGLNKLSRNSAKKKLEAASGQPEVASLAQTA